MTSAEIVAARPLVGHYGNFSLRVSATDRGVPPNAAFVDIPICVNDFNDHAPVFVSPNANVTIRVPEVSSMEKTDFNNDQY